MKKAVYSGIRFSPFFILAAAIVLNLGGWLASLWQRPARFILLALLLAVPPTAWGLRALWQKVKQPLAALQPRRRMVLILFSLLPAILLALAFPRHFNSSLLITPQVSGFQEVVFIELKADGHVVPVADAAADYGWQVDAQGISAGKGARPLLVKVETRAGVPISLLLRASPEGGEVILQHNRQAQRVDLFSETPGQTLYTFRADFRGAPNWLFIPVVYGADMIAYFIYFFIIFLLQDRGAQAQSKKPKVERFLSHRSCLIILIALGAILHTLNALSVPLIFGADSPSFIRGAFHLAQRGNFEGVSQIRGPGATLLFAPVAALFGRNPWGIKSLLHLLAIALIPLSYRIGWQLSGRRWIAFAAGAATALMPDLYFFSNFMMSDLPNLVVISAFTTLLISALQSGQKRWVFGALFTASFGALLRSENLALLALGALALAAQPAWAWISGAGRLLSRRALTVALALLLALMPALWWSWHNYRAYGVFGLGNYAGEVFYTGWIYYAEGSGYPFTDPDSGAVRAIQAAIEEFPIQRMNAAGVPTGWNLHPSLIQAGYAPAEAFDLMSRAVWDSIRANPRMAREVLVVKLKDGLTPVPTQMKTFHLPGEEPPDETLKSAFFDSESLRLPALIRLQRALYQPIQAFYQVIYPLLVWLGLLAVYFSLLRKPGLVWWVIAAIALTRIFIPDIMGKSDWRYTLAGMALVQGMTVLWLAAIMTGIKELAKAAKKGQL